MTALDWVFYGSAFVVAALIGLKLRKVTNELNQDAGETDVQCSCCPRWVPSHEIRFLHDGDAACQQCYERKLFALGAKAQRRRVMAVGTSAKDVA